MWRIIRMTHAEREVAAAGLTFARFECEREQSDGATLGALRYALENTRLCEQLSVPTMREQLAKIPITSETVACLIECADICEHATTEGLRNLAPELRAIALRADSAMQPFG